MVKLYIDDMRDCPYGYIHFKTVNDTLNYIRRMYKVGNTDFYLDLDHDASDIYTPYGGDYINILKNLEDMRNCGKIRNMHIICHFHSGNIVGVDNMRAIVKANRDWMSEV